MKTRKILIFDDADKGIAGRAWRIGAKIFGHSFDDVIAATSVRRAMQDLERIFPLGKPHSVDVEVQIWGHGFDGRPRIAGETITHDMPALLVADTLWLRSCSVMHGEAGHNFSEYLAQRGVDVVGHCGIIGPWGAHSGLVGLRASPDARAWWKRDEYAQRSHPFAPRTIPATQMSIPRWAFEQR